MSNGEQLLAMREAAIAAMERAYAPYSRFRVGAALAARDGHVFVGCNVENASFGAGVCAERAALSAAVACGARDFHRLVIVTEADEPAPPCGICCQVLAELAPGIVIFSRTAAGAEVSWRLAELLPHPFTAQSLDRS